MGAPPAAQPSIENVRVEWRATPRTALAWQRAADQTGNAQGECRGEFTEAVGFPYLAYLKPGNVGRCAWDWPLAAYEKIAADLAFEVGCPVQQAQVWERTSPPAGYPSYACVTLKEFPQYWAWGVVSAAVSQPTGQNSPVSDMLRAVLASASGMLVLDTWIGQGDRGDHPHNVQFGYDPQAPARSKLVYLDFARTLDWNGSWQNDGWRAVQTVAQPSQVAGCLDRLLARQVLERIRGMDDAQIGDICRRLVGPHFSVAQAETAERGLLGRRQLLEPALAPVLTN